MQWVIYDLCPGVPGSIQVAADPNTYHWVSFSISKYRHKEIMPVLATAEPGHADLFIFQRTEKDPGLIP